MDIRKTIVGGRSEEPERRARHSRGIEILLKKAAVDDGFAAALLESRGDAAGLISLELQDAEKRILSSIPADTLRAMIRNTVVKRHQLSAFKTASASLMLAALLVAGSSSCDCGEEKDGSMGIQPNSAPAYAQSRMLSLQEALEAYRTDHGLSYPTTRQWEGGNPLEDYVNAGELIDPWNNAFHYESIEQDGSVANYRLKSRGPDGLDSDDDVRCPIDPDRHSW